MSTPKVLIIPDVHGRTFWKDAIQKFPKEQFPDLDIVFLGDYLDPYESYDGISKEDAFVNFEEILDFANNDDRVTLLIGNHDWHYFVSLDTCRMDRARERDIEHMFIENIDMFRVTKTIEIDGVKYLFSHAGITQKWLDNVAADAKEEMKIWMSDNKRLNEFTSQFDSEIVSEMFAWISRMSEINESHDFELLEQSLQNYDLPFYSTPLSMISRERGGYHPYASVIWADVHEHLYNLDLKGYYQIFGHTITYPNGDPKQYSISPNGHCWAMLDASRAFILDDEGNIEAI